MITQNPIVGRARKKVAGVYARTLWGKNIIQSCPGSPSSPPTKPLRDSREVFRAVTKMANQVPATILAQIYYSAPVGRSRRHVLTSQLFTGVQRNNFEISYNLENFSALGTNPVTTRAALVYEVSAKNFTIAKSEFDATELADTSRAPLVFAISYDLQLCVPLLSNVSVDGDNLVFSNISDSFLGQSVLFVCLWQVNIGSEPIPVWVYGSFDLIW